MKSNLLALTVTVLAGSFIILNPARADVIDLTFEGIAPYPNDNNVLIQGFYNGGTSSIGTSGPNFGVSFSGNALLICLNTIGTSCSNTSRGGLGDPNSQLGSLFFLTGAQTFMNVAAGFDTGFSFNYTAPFEAGSVSVFDGPDGTGNQLATLNLPTTPTGGCPAGYAAPSARSSRSASLSSELPNLLRSKASRIKLCLTMSRSAARRRGCPPFPAPSSVPDFPA
jgi:hypothetical protein